MRAQEGGISEVDENTVAYHFHEPLGVVGQIIPELPDPHGGMEARARHRCRQLRRAQARRIHAPVSILILAELIADLLPPGRPQHQNGFGREAVPLANSTRINKLAFTGSTSTGRLIGQAAANNPDSGNLELGKSPNIFFEDIMDADDAFFDKAIEGLVLFAFNQGEVCTMPVACADSGIDLRQVHALRRPRQRRSPRAIRSTPKP